VGKVGRLFGGLPCARSAKLKSPLEKSSAMAAASIERSCRVVFTWEPVGFADMGNQEGEQGEASY
jgi:hypothetical protein